MKKITLFITVITLLLTITSCDELADLLSVTFEDVAIEQDIDIPLDGIGEKSINLIGDNEPKEFDKTFTLNMSHANDGNSSDQSLSQYLENLTEVNIDSLSFTILDSYNGMTLSDDFSVNMTIVISNDTDTIHTETIENLKAGNEFKSDLNSEKLTLISSTLKDNKNLTIRAFGTTTNDLEADHFTLKVKIIADIKASALSTVEE